MTIRGRSALRGLDPVWQRRKGLFLTDVRVLKILVRGVAEQALRFILKIVDGTLQLVAQEVECAESRDGDKESGRRGDKHLTDVGGQAADVRTGRSKGTE